MENESSDLGLSQPLGFQDFDYQENHIWCEQCKKLKQELKKLQEEQALNYSTLKKKIISTDLLIKKYKGKCDDYDAQNKKYEEFFRKYEDLQRESETLNTQLGSALQQLEPLRKAKAVLEADNKQKEDAVEAMRNRIAGLELSIKQFEEVSKTSETYKDRYDMLKREHQRKKQNLEAVNQKNEVIISKLRDENKTLKQENTVNTRKQKRFEDKIRKVVVKLETYWGLLKRNGLLPKGEKKPVIEKFLDVSGEFSVSQDEEEDRGHVSEMESEDDSSPESDSFPWIFSPVVSALSPLPPSPMPCRANKKLMSNMESDDENVDEMASMLQSELLKSSPVRAPSKPLSLLKKLQTRSQLVDSKQKDITNSQGNSSKSKQESSKNSRQESSKNRTIDGVINGGKAQLLKSKSFTTISAESENLSDSDNEGTKDKSEFVDKENNIKSSSLTGFDNGNENGTVGISEKDEKMSTINNENGRSQSKENTIYHSERSMFQKVKPHKAIDSNEGCSDEIVKENTHAVVVKEVFPPEEKPLDNCESNSKKSVGKVENDKPSNIARKIEFIEKPKTLNSIKGPVSDISETSRVEKQLPSLDVAVDKEKQHSEKSDKVMQKKDDLHKKIDIEQIQAESKGHIEQTKDSIGFDLDDLAYNDNDRNKTITSESCGTPSLDVMISLNKEKDKNSQDKLKTRSQKEISHQAKSNLIENKFDEQHVHKTAETSSVSNLSKEKLLKNVSTEKPSLMSRQVSSGFVLKSPPVIDTDIVGPIFHPLGPKPRIAHKSSISKVKTVSNETSMTKDLHMSKSRSKEMSAKCSERRISQQGSLGFSVDDDSLLPYGGNGDTPKQTSNSIDGTNPADNGLCGKEDSVKTRLENDLLKEKYLTFIRSRISSQFDSQERKSKGNNYNANKISEPLKCNTNHSGETSSVNKVITNEPDTIKRIKKRKDKPKGVNSQTAGNRTMNCDNLNLSSNISKNSITTQQSGVTSKKTLHQLVVNALDSKTIPSSTVISPDVPSISKMEGQRPLSRTSISSPVPLSPLTVSPFDYSLPMLISPLPPSPSNWREPVSPLPGSPWVEDDTSEMQSEKSTPATIVKKSEKKKAKSKPCSFSSIVPTHAIQVKPISACSIKPSAKSADVVPKSTVPEPKPVPCERDPLAMGKKQRISRVPKQTTAPKRKSLDPIDSEIQDKKKCIVDEKGAASVLERPQVQHETGYWKDVDLYLQQYICVYSMTPDDIKDKLSIEKDPTAVLPAVVIWVTQYLRGSEAEMLNNMYRCCNDEDDANTGPFITTQESRLVDLCSYIIQNNFLIEFKTKLLDALWNSIMLKEVVTILGRTAMCRVFTAVCQKEGNVDYVRVLFYNIIASGYPKFITLGLSIIGVWPQVLYKSDTVQSDLLDTLEFCIMKVLLNDREKYEKVLVCYTKLCNWTKPTKMEPNDRLRTLLRELQTVTRNDESESVVSEKQFELNRSLELLLCTEDQTFFKVTFTQLCLNQLYQKIKAKNLINGGLPVMYFKNVLSVYASQLSRRVDTKSALKNIKKFVSGILMLPRVSIEAQEVVVNVLLDIAYIAPMPIFAQLTEWYQREQKNISNMLKQRLETRRSMLVRYEGKLSSFSFN